MSNTIDTPQAPQAPVRRSLWGRLYHGETTFDFVGRRRIGLTISLTVIVISAFFVGFRGLNLGIDFKGGVSWGKSRWPKGSTFARGSGPFRRRELGGGMSDDWDFYQTQIDGKPGSIFEYEYEDFELVDYQHHAAIKAPVAV